MRPATDPNDELAATYLEWKAERMERAIKRGSHHSEELRHDASVLRVAASDIRAGMHRPDPESEGGDA